jgi:predicted Fe-S protein YdhL (DUF1289 family)
MVPRVPPIHHHGQHRNRHRKPLPADLRRSPCARFCIGCGRSLDEIARWIDFDAAERARIMAQLPARLRTLPAAAGTPAKA